MLAFINLNCCRPNSGHFFRIRTVSFTENTITDSVLHISGQKVFAAHAKCAQAVSTHICGPVHDLRYSEQVKIFLYLATEAEFLSYPQCCVYILCWEDKLRWLTFFVTRSLWTLLCSSLFELFTNGLQDNDFYCTNPVVSWAHVCISTNFYSAFLLCECVCARWLNVTQIRPNSGCLMIFLDISSVTS